MSAHWLLAVGFAGMAVAIFFLGWSARIMRVEWRDDRALRAAEARYERHTHRKGDPQETVLLELPRAGRLSRVEQVEQVEQAMVDRGELSAEPPWLFAGESEQGWASESAEYELLTQTAEDCPDCGRKEDCCVCGPGPEDYAAMGMTVEQPVSVTGEPPIDTGELLAITDRVESWIASWTAQGNVDRHTIQASDG